jgi:hypothetical protein
MREQIDIPRCLRAVSGIRITGSPNTGERRKAIEDAIIAIQSDGATALQKEYICVKNYAHFGDQREDHKNGFGPAHGSIVFSIARFRGDDSQVLGPDEIYLLECVRDFPGVQVEERDRYNPYGQRVTRTLNLCDVLSRWSEYGAAEKSYRGMLEGATVDSMLDPVPANVLDEVKP